MKKILIFLLTLSLCLSFVTVGVAAATVDKTDQSAAVLNMMGAIEGDGSGTLGLSGTLTRAQFCKIAVVVMGLSNKVGQYAEYTIFPDVLSTDWEAGYVNLSVRYAGILSGYPDGTFGPDEVVTYGQAVTVMMRMLGYTDTDVSLKWPDGYIEKAAEIGLSEGISLSGSTVITKGEVAVLFVNLLNMERSDSSSTFMASIEGASVISDVFLVSTNTKTDSGVSGAIQIAGAKNATYLPVNTAPESLFGLYGSLVLNAAGKALTFVPTLYGTTIISTVTRTTAGYIQCADGITISMTSSPALYLDGEPADYEDVWIDIDGGMLVSAYYTDGGTVDSVLVTASASAADSVTVVTSDSYALPSSAQIYVNGTDASSADINKYDVLEYDADYNVYNVIRSSITGRYEDAYPNVDTPSTVTVLGKTFELLDAAASALASYSIGTSITLLLTSDNKVAGVYPRATVTRTNYGVVSALSSSSATVRLTNGITVSGSRGTVNSDVDEGLLVKVTSSKTGYLNLYSISEKSVGTSLNISTRTVGSTALSKALKIYECVGSSAVIEISLSDIETAVVSASKILFADYDSSGDISLLLLNDVTGDVYSYGFIQNGSVTQTSGGMSATNLTTSVTNSEGTSDALLGSTGLKKDTVAGIAATAAGHLAGYVTLTALGSVNRYDFEDGGDGRLYVTTDSGLIPVFDDVQAYIDRTETWTTLAKARAYSDNLTVYYDKTLTTGAKVRVVIAY